MIELREMTEQERERYRAGGGGAIRRADGLQR